MNTIRYNTSERTALYNSPSLFSSYIGVNADNTGNKATSIERVLNYGRVYGIIEKNTIAIETSNWNVVKDVEDILSREGVAYRKHEMDVIEDGRTEKHSIYMLKIPSDTTASETKSFLSVAHDVNVMTLAGVGPVEMHGQGERLLLKIGEREAKVTKWVGRLDKVTGEVREEIGEAPSSLSPFERAPKSIDYTDKYGKNIDIDNNIAAAIELYRIITEYASEMMWSGMSFSCIVNGVKNFLKQVGVKSKKNFDIIAQNATVLAFEYVEESCLSDNEISDMYDRENVIDCYRYKMTRDGEQVITGIDGKKILEHLINYNNLKSINDAVYYYNNGVYEPFIKSLEGSGIYPLTAEVKSICPALDLSHKNYVDIAKKIMDELHPIECDDEFRKYTILGNGVLDTKTGEFKKGFARNIISMVRVPWCYNPDAYDKHIDKALDDWFGGDKGLRKYFIQCIGYCLAQNTEQASLFMLWNRQNGAANGKSTALEMLRCLLGGINCTSLNMRQLGDRFMTNKLQGKLANIGDDVAGTYVDSDIAEVLKKVATGNNLEADVKNRAAVEFKPFAKLWFSFNKTMSFNMDKGLQRRIKIIPFGATFIDDNGKLKDPNFIGKITTRSAMEYLLKLAVDGLREVIANKSIIEPEEAIQARTQFFGNADPCAEFFQDEELCEFGDSAESFVKKPRIVMWQLFKNWCSQTGHTTMRNLSLQSFDEMVINRYTVNGKPVLAKGGKNTAKSGIKLYDERGNIVMNVRGEEIKDTWSSTKYVWADESLISAYCDNTKESRQ